MLHVTALDPFLGNFPWNYLVISFLFDGWCSQQVGQRADIMALGDSSTVAPGGYSQCNGCGEREVGRDGEVDTVPPEESH